MGGSLALSAFAQRRQQVPQAVMVDLVHQRELPAEFAAREPFASKPVEVRSGQVGNESTLVFPEGHGDGDKAFKVWGSHAGIVHGFPRRRARRATPADGRDTGPLRKARSGSRSRLAARGVPAAGSCLKNSDEPRGTTRGQSVRPDLRRYLAETTRQTAARLFAC